MNILDSSTDIILVVSGAFFGANARFLIYKKLEQIKVNKNYIIMIINTFSSFCLGLFSSFLSHNSTLLYSYQLGLFFSIGLLGSLSTFSTFIYDLYALLIKFKFYRAFKLFIISLIAGILSFALGFLFGIP